MKNTSETDYVIKCNHVSADGLFDSLVRQVFCPEQTTPSAYCMGHLYYICVILFHLPESLEG